MARTAEIVREGATARLHPRGEGESARRALVADTEVSDGE